MIEEQVTPKRLMVIFAHPDDAEFSVAGTVAKWAAKGTEVTYLLCTSGDRGTSDPDMTPERLAELRQGEQLEAAEVLGVKTVLFLPYTDGMLQATLDLRRDITREIRRFKPDAVICPDPTVRYRGDGYLNHPDHRAAGDAALDAIFPTARDRLAFPELLVDHLEPHAVKYVYISGAAEPNTWVDISETIDLKLEALRKHVSQVGKWAPEQLAERIQGWARENGKAKGIAYAEVFRLMTLS
jgi:LmbE family N-acetylglucosaminyl deacetylase